MDLCGVGFNWDMEAALHDVSEHVRDALTSHGEIRVRVVGVVLQCLLDVLAVTSPVVHSFLLLLPVLFVCFLGGSHCYAFVYGQRARTSAQDCDGSFIDLVHRSVSMFDTARVINHVSMSNIALMCDEYSFEVLEQFMVRGAIILYETLLCKELQAQLATDGIQDSVAHLPTTVIPKKCLERREVVETSAFASKKYHGGQGAVSVRHRDDGVGAPVEEDTKGGVLIIFNIGTIYTQGSSCVSPLCFTEASGCSA